MLTWPISHVYLPSKSPVAKARFLTVVLAIVVHSDIPQMQGLPSQSWRFYPQLVQLHREISVHLL